jgi:glycosyltransferase involved in cell wall biosynthesis
MKNSENYKKNLCIVSSYEFADTNATKARLGVFIDILSERFSVCLIAPLGSDSKDLSAAKLVPLGRAPARGSFGIRALREFGYSFRAWWKVRQLKPDVLLVSSPSMFILLLVKFKICPTILDIRDLTWEYLPGSIYFYRVIKSLLRTFAMKSIHNSDMVWVTNSSEYLYINNSFRLRGVHTPVCIVRNGISSSRFAAIREISDNRDPAQPMLLYVGNVGIAQNLTTIIDVANEFPSLKILIVGAGSDLDRIQKYAKNRLVQNITFVGGILWEDLKLYYSEASILYAQIGENYESAIPSKLYEYLTLGVPVIYGGKGVATDFLTEFDDVQVIEPENPLALSNAIKNLLCIKNPAKNIRNQELIREKYQREDQVRKVLDLVYLLCEK